MSSNSIPYADQSSPRTWEPEIEILLHITTYGFNQNQTPTMIKEKTVQLNHQIQWQVECRRLKLYI